MHESVDQPSPEVPPSRIRSVVCTPASHSGSVQMTVNMLPHLVYAQTDLVTRCRDTRVHPARNGVRCNRGRRGHPKSNTASRKRQQTPHAAAVFA